MVAAGRMRVVAGMALILGATTALQGCGKSAAARDGAVTIDASPDGGPPTTDGAPDDLPGTDGPPDLSGSDGGLPLSELCAAVTADICAYRICVGWEYRDLAHCIAETACLGAMDLSSSVASGAVTYDPVAASQCQARFQSDPCHFGTFLTLPTAFQIFGHCPGTLTPRRGASEACVAAEECTAGLYCKKPPISAPGGNCPGQCTPFAQEGAACANTPCAPGLYCQQTCRPYAHAQDACASDSDCFLDPAVTPRLWCDLVSHTCKPPVGEGQACGIKTPGGNASLQIPCASGLWCDALFIDRTGVCRTPGGAGSPCSDGFGPACTTGLHCVGYEPGVTLGTCAAPATSGGPCDLREECATGLFCIAGVCGPTSPAGGACGQSSDCQPALACDPADFTCRQPRYPGDACGEPDTFCQEGVCRDGHCADFPGIGEPCIYGVDCQLGLGCSRGVCRDSSICVAL